MESHWASNSDAVNNVRKHKAMVKHMQTQDRQELDSNSQSKIEMQRNRAQQNLIEIKKQAKVKDDNAAMPMAGYTGHIPGTYVDSSFADIPEFSTHKPPPRLRQECHMAPSARMSAFGKNVTPVLDLTGQWPALRI